MKMLESASDTKSASEKELRGAGLTASEIRKKYKGYFVWQGISEKRIDFIRRVSFDIIFNESSAITIEDMMVELRELTGIGIVKGYLLVTICFDGSGVLVDGNMIYPNEVSKELLENILKAGRREIIKAGGMTTRKELFLRIREGCNRPLSDRDLSASLFNKGTKLRLTEREGELFVYIKKR